MNMSEKMAALSDPEYGNHYSSLPNEEILRLWDTTQLKDTERYFIYREVLARGLESHLLFSQKKRRKFLFHNEYLIAEFMEDWWPGGGFATLRSNLLYVAFIFLPGIVGYIMGKSLEFLGEPYVFMADNSWPALISIWLVLLCLILAFLFLSGLLTRSDIFVTNQRIGYHRTLLQIFKLPPKWLNLNDGHLISGTHQYWKNFPATFLGISTKEQALKNAYTGFRLDRYDLGHQRINFVLNLITSIYLFELIQLVSSKTKAVVYNVPILYPKNIDDGLLVNYRFRGSQPEDLLNFFKTIDQRGVLRAKNVVYMGKTNMERLALFFASSEATWPANQPDEPSPDNPETILTYLPGSYRGVLMSPLICLTTTSVKYYEYDDGRMIFEHCWSDPNLTVGISLFSVNIMYNKNKRINMYWNVIDIPIIDIIKALGVKQIYSCTKYSFWDQP